MTSIQNALLESVLQNPDFPPLVGNRVYLDNLPYSPTYPAMTIVKITDVGDREIISNRTARLTLNCASGVDSELGVYDTETHDTLVRTVITTYDQSILNKHVLKWTCDGVSFAVFNVQAEDQPYKFETRKSVVTPVDLIINYRRLK